MSFHFFWSEELESLNPGQLFHLSKEEAHHLFNVLRIAEGSDVGVMNGRGWKGRAEVVQTPQDRQLRLLDKQLLGGHPNLHLCGPVPKGKRFSMMMEKCQEIGVRQFTPLRCEHSCLEELSPAKIKKTIERLKAACKQSANPWMMQLHPSATLNDILKKSPIFILHTEGEKLLQQRLPSSSLLLYGPEAGWSPEELDSFKQQNVQKIKIAPFILRMETAAIVGSARLMENMSS